MPLFANKTRSVPSLSSVPTETNSPKKLKIFIKNRFKGGPSQKRFLVVQVRPMMRAELGRARAGEQGGRLADNEHVLWLDVAVRNSLAVAVAQA